MAKDKRAAYQNDDPQPQSGEFLRRNGQGAFDPDRLEPEPRKVPA